MMRRDALLEYVRSSLWVLPSLSVIAALIAGSVLSMVNVGADSPLAFQGTADHLAHSIQVDAIMRVVERNTLAVIREGLFVSSVESVRAPEAAVPVPARGSGYVQAVHVGRLMSVARRHRICLRLRPRV